MTAQTQPPVSRRRAVLTIVLSVLAAVLVIVWASVQSALVHADVDAAESAPAAVEAPVEEPLLGVAPRDKDGFLNLIYPSSGQIVREVRWPSMEPCDETMTLPIVSPIDGNVAGSIEVCSGA